MGRKRLEVLEREPVDIIVSDITMPTMNGFDFLRNSRLNGYDKPFIVLTGNATKSTAMEALRLGAYDFLEKPFEPSHMKTLFADAMKSSKDQQNISTTPRQTSAPDYIRLPSEETEVSNAWERGETCEQFIDSFSAQLSFCKASTKGLLYAEQAPKELGYLFRVMRSLAAGAKHWKLYDLSSFSHEMTEILLYFRTNPDYLTQNYIQTISNGLNSLVNVFNALKEQNSVMAKSFELRSSLLRLNVKLNGHSDEINVEIELEDEDEVLEQAS